MRTLRLSAIAASTVLAWVAIGLSTDANAASRRPQHRAPHHDPYRAYNTFGATGVDAFHTGRDRHPISGTPRWNAAGGAP